MVCSFFMKRYHHPEGKEQHLRPDNLIFGRVVPVEPAEYEDDIRQQEQWFDNFCRNAPDQEAGEYLRRHFSNKE